MKWPLMPKAKPEPQPVDDPQFKVETFDSFDSILSRYDILDVNTQHGFIIAEDKNLGNQYAISTNGGSNVQLPPHMAKSFKEKPKMGEMISTSNTAYINYDTEYNNELRGQAGIDRYIKMRNDGVVNGTLLAIKTPILAGRWFIEPIKDKKKDKVSKKDQDIADFVWDCLTERMSTTFSQTLWQILLQMDYGYYAFEKVWELKDGDLILKKMAPRSPSDIIKIRYDANGGPDGIDMVNLDGSPVTIPIDKLLLFPHRMESNNYMGRSVLRTAYKDWYFKENLAKIDAIQKERHGIGIPIIKLPPGAGDDAIKDANELGRNIRTNERAHIVLPNNWEITFAELHGNPVSALESMKYHDDVMRENILAGFLGSDKVTKEEDLGLFLKSTRYVADGICDIFNKYLIPQLVDYNFEGVKKYPKLKVRRIGEQGELRTISFALRNMIGAGVVRPDDVLEAYIRDLFDLPLADLETARVVAAPQAGQSTGTTPVATPGKGITPQDLPNNTPANGKSGAVEAPTGASSVAANPLQKDPQIGMPRQTLPKPGVGSARVGDSKGQS